MRKGFTLVELLVVISIIGLLATVAVVALGSARAKARDAKRIADVRNIQSALEQYYSDQGGYPVAASITLGVAGANALCSEVVAGFKASPCTNSTYMGLVPQYPIPGPTPASVACGTPLRLNLYCYNAAAAPTYAVSYALTFSLSAPTAGFSDTNVNGGIDCTASQSGLTCN